MQATSQPLEINVTQAQTSAKAPHEAPSPLTLAQLALVGGGSAALAWE